VKNPLQGWELSENEPNLPYDFLMELSPEVIHGVENYRLVISGENLAPASGEGKTSADKAKAADHIPGTDARDWIFGSAYIEDDDPD
jgi:hypothetical protein